MGQRREEAEQQCNRRQSGANSNFGQNLQGNSGLHALLQSCSDLWQGF